MMSSTTSAQPAITAGRSDYPRLLDEAWRTHLAPPAADAPTVISTFAGGGGSSLGYSMAGYCELLAVEWDDNAVATLRLNFPEVALYHGDIGKLSVEEVLERTGLARGQLDVFDGSPPCQGFSTSGKREFDDPRNQLFREYVRLLRGLQPRTFVMENVSGMVKGKMRLIFADVLRELKGCGYRVRARLLNAMYFGVPQSRERMIFIGVREDLGIEPSHPRAQQRPYSLRDVLGAMSVREGWGPTNLVAAKNRDFANKWRSAALPCSTIVKTRPPIILLADGSQREMTAAECALIGSFPAAYRWAGTDKDRISRIGNSVPPLFMRAIARHVRDRLLA